MGRVLFLLGFFIVLVIAFILIILVSTQILFGKIEVACQIEGVLSLQIGILIEGLSIILRDVKKIQIVLIVVVFIVILVRVLILARGEAYLLI